MKTLAKTFGAAALLTLTLAAVPAAVAVPADSPSARSAAAVPAAPGPSPLHEFSCTTVAELGYTHDLARYRCYTLSVPLSYATPAAGTIDVSFSVLRAKSAASGAIFVDPGGPGVTGIAQRIDSRIEDKFDVIGMNPRGTELSNPIFCDGIDRPEDPRLSPLRFPEYTAKTVQLEASCERRNGTNLRYYTTANTARDMDMIRRALNLPTFNYYGVSYGTYLGAVYASLFPQNMGRMVLDSSMHPDWVGRKQFAEQIPAMTKAFRRWARWTAGHNDTYGLGATEQAVVDSYDAIVNKLTEDQRYTWDINQWNIASKRNWVWQADALAQIRRGERSGDYLSDGASAPDDSGDKAELRPALFDAINCEGDWPEEPFTYFGEATYNSNVNHYFQLRRDLPQPCTFRLPAFRPEGGVVTLHAPGSGGIVIGNELDVQTPYEGSPAMANRLGFDLLTIRDEGSHGVGMSNSCAASALTEYYLHGTRPPQECASEDSLE